MLCIAHCVASKMTAVDVASKVSHVSLNIQKDSAIDSNECKANHLLAMNNDQVTDTNQNQMSSPVKPKEVVADVVIIQT